MTLIPTLTPCAQGQLPCAQGQSASITTQTIYYWAGGHFTREVKMAQVADDFDIYGSKSQTLQAPLEATDNDIKALIAQALSPCAQGHPPCAQGEVGYDPAAPNSDQSIVL